MEQTAARAGFIAPPASCYRKLIAIMASHGAVALILGRFQGEAVAAGITFAFGETAWTVYRGQSNSRCNIYAYHALVWEQIKRAQSRGARRFDFYGVPENAGKKDLLSGIHYFKKSFGGDCCAYIGEYDLVLSRDATGSGAGSIPRRTGFHAHPCSKPGGEPLGPARAAGGNQGARLAGDSCGCFPLP